MEEPPGTRSLKTGGKSAGATRKGLETRARIIKGAREALEDGGIEALTTRKIASSADVRLATLHYYFDSKEAILRAVLEDLIADMDAAYRQDDPLPDDPRQRVEALIRASWRYIKKTRNKQIAQTELTIYALRTSGAEWLAALQYNAYVDFYAQLVFPEVGTDERLIAIGRAVARQLLIGIDGLILQHFAMQDEAIANESVEAMVVATQDFLQRRLDEVAD